MHPLQLEDVLTCDKERMKSTKTGSVHQVIVGRANLTESSQGYPQIRKEQVKEEGEGVEGGEGREEGGNRYLCYFFPAGTHTVCPRWGSGVGEWCGNKNCYNSS